MEEGEIIEKSDSIVPESGAEGTKSLRSLVEEIERNVLTTPVKLTPIDKPDIPVQPRAIEFNEQQMNERKIKQLAKKKAKAAKRAATKGARYPNYGNYNNTGNGTWGIPNMTPGANHQMGLPMSTAPMMPMPGLPMQFHYPIHQGMVTTTTTTNNSTNFGFALPPSPVLFHPNIYSSFPYPPIAIKPQHQIHASQVHNTLDITRMPSQGTDFNDICTPKIPAKNESANSKLSELRDLLLSSKKAKPTSTASSGTSPTLSTNVSQKTTPLPVITSTSPPPSQLMSQPMHLSRIPYELKDSHFVQQPILININASDSEMDSDFQSDDSPEITTIAGVGMIKQPIMSSVANTTQPNLVDEPSISVLQPIKSVAIIPPETPPHVPIPTPTPSKSTQKLYISQINAPKKVVGKAEVQTNQKIINLTPNLSPVLKGTNLSLDLTENKNLPDINLNGLDPRRIAEIKSVKAAFHLNLAAIAKKRRCRLSLMEQLNNINKNITLMEAKQDAYLAKYHAFIPGSKPPTNPLPSNQAQGFTPIKKQLSTLVSSIPPPAKRINMTLLPGKSTINNNSPTVLNMIVPPLIPTSMSNIDHIPHKNNHTGSINEDKNALEDMIVMDTNDKLVQENDKLFPFIDNPFFILKYGKKIQLLTHNNEKEQNFEGQFNPTPAPTLHQSKDNLYQSDKRIVVNHEENNNVMCDLKLGYESPLLHMRSYRLNPNFKSVFNKTITMTTYSHKININTELCMFENNGSCMDKNCVYQHKREYALTSAESLFEQLLLSYYPSELIPSNVDREQFLSNYSSDILSTCTALPSEQRAMLLVEKINILRMENLVDHNPTGPISFHYILTTAPVNSMGSPTRDTKLPSIKSPTNQTLQKSMSHTYTNKDQISYKLSSFMSQYESDLSFSSLQLFTETISSMCKQFQATSDYKLDGSIFTALEKKGKIFKITNIMQIFSQWVTYMSKKLDYPNHDLLFTVLIYWPNIIRRLDNLTPAQVYEFYSDLSTHVVVMAENETSKVIIYHMYLKIITVCIEALNRLPIKHKHKLFEVIQYKACSVTIILDIIQQQKGLEKLKTIIIIVFTKANITRPTFFCCELAKTQSSGFYEVTVNVIKISLHAYYQHKGLMASGFVSAITKLCTNSPGLLFKACHLPVELDRNTKLCFYIGLTHLTLFNELPRSFYSSSSNTISLKGRDNVFFDLFERPNLHEKTRPLNLDIIVQINYFKAHYDNNFFSKEYLQLSYQNRSELHLASLTAYFELYMCIDFNMGEDLGYDTFLHKYLDFVQVDFKYRDALDLQLKIMTMVMTRIAPNMIVLYPMTLSYYLSLSERITVDLKDLFATSNHENYFEGYIPYFYQLIRHFLLYYESITIDVSKKLTSAFKGTSKLSGYTTNGLTNSPLLRSSPILGNMGQVSMSSELEINTHLKAEPPINKFREVLKLLKLCFDCFYNLDAQYHVNYFDSEPTHCTKKWVHFLSFLIGLKVPFKFIPPMAKTPNAKLFMVKSLDYLSLLVIILNINLCDGNGADVSLVVEDLMDQFFSLLSPSFKSSIGSTKDNDLEDNVLHRSSQLLQCSHSLIFKQHHRVLSACCLIDDANQKIELLEGYTAHYKNDIYTLHQLMLLKLESNRITLDELISGFQLCTSMCHQTFYIKSFIQSLLSMNHIDIADSVLRHLRNVKIKLFYIDHELAALYLKITSPKKLKNYATDDS